MLVAREIENKAFAKVCCKKKNCIMGKLKVELTDLQLELGLPGVSGGQVG